MSVLANRSYVFIHAIEGHHLTVRDGEKGPVVIEMVKRRVQTRIERTLLLDSGVLGFHAVHKSPLIYKVIEKEGL